MAKKAVKGSRRTPRVASSSGTEARSEIRARILRVIRCIPKGSVSTYGQVAALAGLPGHARQVGEVLASEGDDVPWHRVINAKGEISLRSGDDGAELQRARLMKEGITFDFRGRVDLLRRQWNAQDSKAKRLGPKAALGRPALRGTT